MELLKVKNLKTNFFIDAGMVQAVRGVDISLGKGESLGIVGESGSGKSVTMLSIMGLLEENSSVDADELKFNGENLLDKREDEMRKISGGEIGMIFQDPMSSLNPLFTVGNQITEPIRLHNKISKKDAEKKALKMLEMVEISSPESRMNQYPHELSGGMRQRVMIAMAMSCNPKLLIADEPTTALDVTIQAQILDLMKTLKEKTETSIILITHDLGVIANMCEKIVVMYGGTVVEKGSKEDIFYNSKHPYTWGLLNSIPKCEGKKKDKLVPIPGSPPDLLNPPKGCPFTPRCAHGMKICQEYIPGLKTLSKTHSSACWMLHPSMPKDEKREGER
ncbi:MAG: ABC transporter ATP-binding protein [Fusobacteriaceae bacterium]